MLIQSSHTAKTYSMSQAKPQTAPAPESQDNSSAEPADSFSSKFVSGGVHGAAYAGIAVGAIGLIGATLAFPLHMGQAYGTVLKVAGGAALLGGMAGGLSAGLSQETPWYQKGEGVQPWTPDALTNVHNPYFSDY